jgi:hypothetical protein
MAFKINKSFDKKRSAIQNVATYKNWDLIYYPTIKGYEWMNKKGGLSAKRLGIFTHKADALHKDTLKDLDKGVSD